MCFFFLLYDSWMVSYSLWLLMLTSAPRLEFKLFCVFSEGLHSPCCLWGTSNSSSECRISRWCVYSLPDHSHKNGIALVLSLSLMQLSIRFQLYTGLCIAPFWFQLTFLLFCELLYKLCRFCKRSLLSGALDHSLIDQIPGRQNDRKTLLGELNWIFTAITDTIAWNVLPHGTEGHLS